MPKRLKATEILTNPELGKDILIYLCLCPFWVRLVRRILKRFENFGANLKIFVPIIFDPICRLFTNFRANLEIFWPI